MTEPRPRLTNRIGNVQQTSVVSDDANPNTVSRRGRMKSSLCVGRPVANAQRQQREEKSEQEGERMQMRGIVRAGEGRDRAHSRERDVHLEAAVGRDRRCRRQRLVLLDGRGYLMRCRVAHASAAIIWRPHAGARVIGLRAARHRLATVAQFGQGRRPRRDGKKRCPDGDDFRQTAHVLDCLLRRAGRQLDPHAIGGTLESDV
jgi:hypothetical protein